RRAILQERVYWPCARTSVILKMVEFVCGQVVELRVHLMRSIQLIHDLLVRQRGLAALAVTLLCAGLGLADRFPPDPVEELRLALKAVPPNPNVARRAEALRSLADMRRALGLQEWGSQVGGMYQQVRAALADRVKPEAG